ADIQPNPPTINKTGQPGWGAVLSHATQSGTFSYDQPDVWGIPPANVPSSGTLSYSLADATAVRYNSAGVSSSGTLNDFYLTINLNGANAPSFKAALNIEVDGTEWAVLMPSAVTGSMDG